MRAQRVAASTVVILAALCAAVPDLSAEPKRYYLAEGVTGGFVTEIDIANPTGLAVNVQADFLTEWGQKVTRNYPLPPFGTVSVVANDIPELANVGFSTVVTSPNGTPLLVSRRMSWGDADTRGRHTENAATELRENWHFAEGFQSWFDTYILIQNPHATSVDANIRFFREGESPIDFPVQLLPESRYTLWAGSVPGLVGRAFSFVVSALKPVLTERAMYWPSEGVRWRGGHASMGVGAPAKQWFFAEGATGSFETFILVANPNLIPVKVTAMFMTEGAAGNVVQEHWVEPERRLTLPVATLASELSNASFSVYLVADHDIVAERAMYWPRGTWREGHGSFGLTRTPTQLGLGGLRVADDTNTFVLTARTPGATSGSCEGVWFSNGAILKTGSFSAVEGGRVTSWINYVPALGGRDDLAFIGNCANTVLELSEFASGRGGGLDGWVNSGGRTAAEVDGAGPFVIPAGPFRGRPGDIFRVGVMGSSETPEVQFGDGPRLQATGGGVSVPPGTGTVSVQLFLGPYSFPYSPALTFTYEPEIPPFPGIAQGARWPTAKP